MQTAMWTMKGGQKIRICDMTDDHLFNTLCFIQRFNMQNRRGKPFKDSVRASFWLLLEEAEDRGIIEVIPYEELGLVPFKRVKPSTEQP